MLIMLGLSMVTESKAQLMLMMLELSVTASSAKPRWCFGCLGWKAEPA